MSNLVGDSYHRASMSLGMLSMAAIVVKYYRLIRSKVSKNVGLKGDGIAEHPGEAVYIFARQSSRQSIRCAQHVEDGHAVTRLPAARGTEEEGLGLLT